MWNAIVANNSAACGTLERSSCRELAQQAFTVGMPLLSSHKGHSLPAHLISGFNPSLCLCPPCPVCVTLQSSLGLMGRVALADPQVADPCLQRIAANTSMGGEQQGAAGAKEQ